MNLHFSHCLNLETHSYRWPEYTLPVELAVVRHGSLL